MEELECDLVVEFVSLPREQEAAWWASLRAVMNPTPGPSPFANMAKGEGRDTEASVISTISA